MSLLQMSISAGLTIFAITVIRALTINRLPKKTFLALWGIVLARLLLPFSLPSPLSVYSLINHSVIEHVGGVPLVNTLPIAPGTNITAAPSAEFSLWVWIWIAGATLSTLYFVIAYIRCRRGFITSLPVENAFVKQWLRAHKCKRHIKIHQTSVISAPLTYGIFRPVILMPTQTDWTDTKKLQYVLTHEYVHIRRFDGVTKFILTVALCVHWFNPLVWTMYILANRDIELSCDEKVVRIFGETVKSAYALALISMEEKKSGITPLCNNFSKNAIEERIEAIMKTKRTTLLAIFLACFIVLGTASAFATSAIASNDKEMPFNSNQVDADLYSIYEPFGLTIDAQTGKLYYDGKMVRCFDDQIPKENFSAKGIGYYEKDGVIDIRAIRENSTSKLLRLEMLSDTEFQKRIIDDPMQPVSQTGTDIFNEYKVYGLSYDNSQNTLFYNDERVRLFMDVRNSNGKPIDSKDFLGSTTSNLNANGTIDVYAVRDNNQTDENGDKKLTGLRIATQDEFDAATKSFGQTTRTVESAE